jgi:hypothetical protein
MAPVLRPPKSAAGDAQHIMTYLRCVKRIGNTFGQSQPLVYPPAVSRSTDPPAPGIHAFGRRLRGNDSHEAISQARVHPAGTNCSGMVGCKDIRYPVNER